MGGLTALAQLRTAAIRTVLIGSAVLPAAAAGSGNTARAASGSTVSVDDLRIYPGDAPLPVRGGQPCPPGIPPIGLSATETARIERLARDRKPGSSPPPASPSISAGQHDADATRPAPAGTTTPPASRPSPHDPRRTKGGDNM